MTNLKQTKRALLTSVMALFLCFTMLLGTTYAWFTDSVSSANNIITAGNLDVDLEYYVGGDWKKVTETTNVFEENTLWEPGHTEVVYLKVSNLGTLALKYNLSINVAKEVAGINTQNEIFKLSNIVEYQVIDLNPFATYTDRAAARAAVTAPAKLASAYSKAAYLTSQGDAHYVAMVVYMPESVGNEANYKAGTTAPSLNLGIRLFATQYTSEKDSFDFTYDNGAPWTGMADTSWYDADPTATEFVIKSPEALAGLAQIVNSGMDTFEGNTVKLGGDIDLNNLLWTPIGINQNGKKFQGTFLGNGYTISNLYVTGKSGVGLFGYTAPGTHLEGLTIDGAYVAGNDYVGVVLGSGYLAANCIKDCTVMNATIIATPYLKADGVTYDGGAKAGVIAGYARNGNIYGNKAIDCTVSAYRDLGGIVGMAQGENRPITASGNEVDGVKLSYITVFGKYDSDTPNQNMGSVVGRASNATIADDNVVKGESEADETLSFAVSNDAELAQVLTLIKTSSNLWSREIEIILNENTYSADHVIYQYPQWNGVVGKVDGTNYASGVAGAPYTLLTFKGNNAVFTGNVTVKGFGNSDTGFTTATAKTTFMGVTFDGANSVEANGEDYIVAYVVAAANDVTFDTCTFKNATHVTLGGSNYNGVGTVNVTNCTFNDGGCLSGSFATLNVTNTNVTAAKNGFINKASAGAVTVKDCDITAGKYFLRTATGGSGVNMTVENTNVTMYESEGAKDLVKFRGKNESAAFTDCNIAEGYTTAGVDADSTLKITNFTETEDGLTLKKDGVSGEVTLYLVPADYEGSTVNVPEGVDAIGNYAFAYNSNVKEVVLASTVRDLGRGFDSSTVEKVVLNEGLTTISSRAFRSTPNLTEVVISSTVTTIADNAFQKSGISTITIPATVQTIGETAFGASLVETVIIEGNTNIEGYAFRGCTKLRTVYLNGLDVNFVKSSLSGRNSMWFCNGESNNPNTSNITFYVKNEVIKERVLTAMGAERNNTPVICEMESATDENGESLGYYVDEQNNAFAYDVKGLEAALNADSGEVSTVTLVSDLKFSSSETTANSGYGATGVSVKGGVLDGNGNSLGITNWGTWDAAVHTTGGTIKNLVVNSGMRGIFMGSATGDVYIDHVIIDGTVYTFNSDGGSKSYGVYISNSTLNGWTSHSDVHKEVVYTNCSFGEGSGYAFCRPYGKTVFENCIFEEGFKLDTSKTSDITFKNCYYGDTLITAENAAALSHNGIIFFYNGLNGITINGKKAINASNATEFNNALTSSDKVSVTLSEGNYTLPGVSNGDVSISGTKDTVIAVSTPAFHGSDVTLNGVTVKGSGYATGVQHVNTVTYNDVTINGEMCLYGEKVVFNGCTFNLAKGQYIWTYGAKEVEFNNCIFNTAGKAILIYNEGAGASKVTVKGCTFNATAGDKAGAIANQNCAAIEIDNFQNSGIGTAHTLITENNTYSENFSGEWRIKNYVAGNVVTVNGTEYTQIAVDGKLMTIDASKNVTVQ